MADEQNAPVRIAAEAAAPEAPAPEARKEPPLVYFTLSGAEGELIQISAEASEQSKAISDLVFGLEFSVENAAKQPVIPFNNIKHSTLLKVVEWCEQHKGEAMPEEDENVPKQTKLPEWDRAFLEMSDDELFDLVIAANYLDIKRLLVYSCKKIALMAVGKTPEELRAIFEIPTDEEDEKRAREAAEKAGVPYVPQAEYGPSTSRPSTSRPSTSTQGPSTSGPSTSTK